MLLSAIQAAVIISCGGFQGSAFAIDERTLVTAHHVQYRTNCTIGAGSSLRLGQADEAQDFVTLVAFSGTFTPVPVSCSGMVAGQTYTIVGAKGQFSVVATGRHFNTVDPEYRKSYSLMAQATGTVPVGASGGPVYNQDGEAVGVVSSATETHTYIKELSKTSVCEA